MISSHWKNRSNISASFVIYRFLLIIFFLHTGIKTDKVNGCVNGTQDSSILNSPLLAIKKNSKLELGMSLPGSRPEPDNRKWVSVKHIT